MPTVQVLVIEGSHAARYRLRIALRQAGAQVTTAPSIEEALPLLEHAHGPARPDLVLANRILPGMNGLELIDLLHLDPATASLPVAITGAGEHWPLRELALERGALAVLPGDVDAAALAAVLAQLWEPAGRAPIINPAASGLSLNHPPPRRFDPSRHLPLGLLIAVAGAALLTLLLTHP